MKKVLKFAAVAVALTMFVSAAAEAQGGGGGGGGGGGQGRGRGGRAGAIVADGVSADSAYALLMTSITLDAPKKAAVVVLITKLQTDLKATPAPARGARGAVVSTADSTANAAIVTKRNVIINTFRTEAKKSMDATQQTQFDMNFPDPTAARRGGGGGG